MGTQLESSFFYTLLVLRHVIMDLGIFTYASFYILRINHPEVNGMSNSNLNFFVEPLEHSIRSGQNG